ncbi:hypothetical protein DHEL01_v207645 [Diaporthe helianthi]|uniref:Peptidase A1 domain-containing protein n=1 Tax=Diaporthe helianthi TaxID=158607 RepID=A0A2P5HUQ0_DIAHE|nr:hypothetical protein DHEL01_v207645 [Diaporthe helianthi]
MRIKMFLTTAFLLVAPFLAKGAARPSSNQLFRKDHEGSVISVPLTDHTKNNGKTDLQWYAKVSVGTPPQEFNVLIDTGSSGLLLPSGNCTTCGQQTLFDFSQSSTFSWSQELFEQVGFGTSGDTIPVSGPVRARCVNVSDSVSIQGLTADEYRFILCDEQDSSLSDQGEIDGILGLPIEADNEAGPGLEWALYDAGLLADPIFGIYTPPGQITGGQLTLGGVDKTKYKGDLIFVDLNKELAVERPTWILDIQTMFVDGEQLRLPVDNSTAKAPYPQALSILDTGTAHIQAPTYQVARDIYAKISPEIYQIDPVGTWGAPCAVMETIASDITFLFGYDGAATQVKLTLPGKSVNLGPYPGKEGICQGVITNSRRGQLHEDGRGVWVIGSPLLKQYYTAWDGRDLRVGFAPLKVS